MKLNQRSTVECGSGSNSFLWNGNCWLGAQVNISMREEIKLKSSRFDSSHWLKVGSSSPWWRPAQAVAFPLVRLEPASDESWIFFSSNPPADSSRAEADFGPNRPAAVFPQLRHVIKRQSKRKRKKSCSNQTEFKLYYLARAQSIFDSSRSWISSLMKRISIGLKQQRLHQNNDRRVQKSRLKAVYLCRAETWPQ